jgi:hypothetical protein
MDLKGFRSMFAEASDQLRSGDAPSDLKVQFMRIIPFEVLHLLSTNLDHVLKQLRREGKGPAELPLGTLERLNLLVRCGMVPEAKAAPLREAFEDILMWRTRTSVSEGGNHPMFDPMLLTLDEHTRMTRHIATIRAWISSSTYVAKQTPLIVC